MEIVSRTSSGLLEPDTGERGKRFMKEKIRYTDEPLGDPKVVSDFLPRPEDLVLKDEGVKVTISLSKRSIDFFKSEAKKHDTQYQRMIRRLLDSYAEWFSKHPVGSATRHGSGKRQK
jgi:hypothetical protein